MHLLLVNPSFRFSRIGHATRSISTLFLFAVLFGITSSCETGGSEKFDINHRWNVVNATRNGRLTTTLKDAYFDLSSDSVMRTNIFGSPAAFEYDVTRDQIRQYGEQEVVYDINFHVRDTIILSANIYSYQFQFLALRDTVTIDSLVQ